MSELKVYRDRKDYIAYDDFLLEAYDKSEADKVIAEKDKAIVYAKALVLKDIKLIAHQKYKRCLAMADFCESQHDYYNAVGNGFWLVRGNIETRDKYRKKASDFWWKWHRRWLELAEKFKEDK